MAAVIGGSIIVWISVLALYKGYNPNHSFCAIEVKATVVAVQQPSVECTALYTPCIVEHHTPPCSVRIQNTCKEIIGGTHSKTVPASSIKGQFAGDTSNTLTLFNWPLVNLNVGQMRKQYLIEHITFELRILGVLLLKCIVGMYCYLQMVCNLSCWESMTSGMNAPPFPQTTPSFISCIKMN